MTSDKNVTLQSTCSSTRLEVEVSRVVPPSPGQGGDEGRRESLGGHGVPVADLEEERVGRHLRLRPHPLARVHAHQLRQQSAGREGETSIYDFQLEKDEEDRSEATQ